MIEVKCVNKPWADAVQFAVVSSGEYGRRFRAQPLVMEEIKPGEFIEPTFELDTMAAQGLMDALWRCGLRPTEGTGSAGSLAATERHLKDMQTIALGLLKKEGAPL